MLATLMNIIYSFFFNFRMSGVPRPPMPMQMQPMNARAGGPGMTNMSVPQSMNPQGMPGMQPQNAQAGGVRANYKYTSGVRNVAGPGQQVVSVTPQQVMQQQQPPQVTN